MAQQAEDTGGGSGGGWLIGRMRNRKVQGGESQGGALSRGVLVETQATARTALHGGIAK